MTAASTITADANTVTSLLADRLAQTERENAILQAQLQAALKLIPQDVLDTINGGGDDAKNQ